jgi:hypothetical protein
MEEIMKFAKKPSLFHVAVLFAGLLTVPAAAQQEVAPDHFEDHPAIAQGKRPAATKSQAASTRSRRTSTSASTPAKPKIASTTVLKADAGKGEPVPSSR